MVVSMTASTRGRHRKLRRNILHTVVATALLAGTFTVVDQVSDQKVANAAETTGQAGELVFTTDSAENRSPVLLAVGSFVTPFAKGYFARQSTT